MGQERQKRRREGTFMHAVHLVASHDACDSARDSHGRDSFMASNTSCRGGIIIP